MSLFYDKIGKKCHFYPIFVMRKKKGSHLWILLEPFMFIIISIFNLQIWKIHFKFYQNIKNRVKMTFLSRFCHKKRNIVFSDYVLEPIDEFTHCNSSMQNLDDSIDMIVSNSKNGVKMTIYPIFATRKEKNCLVWIYTWASWCTLSFLFFIYKFGQSIW